MPERKRFFAVDPFPNTAQSQHIQIWNVLNKFETGARSLAPGTAFNPICPSLLEHIHVATIYI